MDKEVKILLIAVVVILLTVIGLVMGYQTFKVYSQEMTGKAEFARAEQNRQILVSQAKAEKESAKLRAEAIEIVGAAAQKYPEYRNQEFIGAFADALKDGKINQIIYVPTEANIPILEAGRR